MTSLSNCDLAKEFDIDKSTVQNVLANKWVSINDISVEGTRMRECPLKWQQLEAALWLLDTY